MYIFKTYLYTLIKPYVYNSRIVNLFFYADIVRPQKLKKKMIDVLTTQIHV